MPRVELRRTRVLAPPASSRMAWNAWRRKCAMTPASDGRFSISQCFSTDGLRRSAFDSTPLRVKPTEPEKSSMTVSYRILPYPTVSYRILPYPTVSYRILPYPTVSYGILRDPTGRSANRIGKAADIGSTLPSTCIRARSCRFCLRVLPRCIGGPMTLRCPLGSPASLGVLF